MKRIIILILCALMSLCLVACNEKDDESKKTEELKSTVDYSDTNNWVVFNKDGSKNVDILFIYPTLVMQSPRGDFSTLGECRELASNIVTSMASAFEEVGNIYMPLYHQATLTKASQMNKSADDYREMLHNNVPYLDVKAALDYYFENCNNGKPFIVAGHSQGAAMTINIVAYYLAEHPEYYSRMIAAYALGFSCSKEFANAHPTVKAAQGESDTGVLITWNCEGPNATGTSTTVANNSIIINPLNWKTDDTYADASSNKGSLIDGEIQMNYSDAKIDLTRGTLVCNTALNYLVFDSVFQTNCLHNGDYSLFYNNIKENVGVRTAAYMESKNK